jgi:hypothetical protein
VRRYRVYEHVGFFTVNDGPNGRKVAQAENRADADTVAAALSDRADLLAALAALVEAHDEEPKTLTAAEWDAARAAIAKAEGGAS